MKSHYQLQFSTDKSQEYKTLNQIQSKEIKDKEKEKEYVYPPLPTIQSVKKAYL